jgi:hypothetical protein
MRRSNVVFSICLLVSPFCRHAALRGEARVPIPTAKLLEDVGVLQRVYETAHPGL